MRNAPFWLCLKALFPNNSAAFAVRDRPRPLGLMHDKVPSSPVFCRGASFPSLAGRLHHGFYF